MSPRPLRFYQAPGGLGGGSGGLGNPGFSQNPSPLPPIHTGPAPASLRPISDAEIGPALAPPIASNERLSSSVGTMFERRREKRKDKNLTSDLALVGLLFARPSDDFAAKKILPELDYFDIRSGEYMDFFCVGYSKQSTAQSSPVTKVKGQQWWFSNDSFNKLREQITRESKWVYSGQAELLLANAKASGSKSFIDYSSAIQCRLEEMEKDKAFNSVSEFFEKIFTYAENPGLDPAFNLSDLFGKKLAISAAKKTVLKILLRSLAPEYDRAKHFVLVNLSKKK